MATQQKARILAIGQVVDHADGTTKVSGWHLDPIHPAFSYGPDAGPVAWLDSWSVEDLREIARAHRAGLNG